MIINLTNNEHSWITYNTEAKFVSSKFMIFACALTTIVAFIGCMVEVFSDF